MPKETIYVNIIIPLAILLLMGIHIPMASNMPTFLNVILLLIYPIASYFLFNRLAEDMSKNYKAYLQHGLLLSAITLFEAVTFIIFFILIITKIL